MVEGPPRFSFGEVAACEVKGERMSEGVWVREIEVAGRKLSFEVGRVAKQADGAVLASYGDTVVLVTACMSDSVREGIDFFPLVVDFEEKFYAAGKIPGGFIKREGKPSEQAILSARLVDRSIRSLFPDHLRNEVQVVATVLCVDQKNPPSVVAINGASMALALSGIPWNGPVGAVRIGYVDGALVVNLTEDQADRSLLDLVVAGHEEGICMVEAGACEVSEELMVEALSLAHEEIKRIVAFQREVASELGKPRKEVEPPYFDEALAGAVEEEFFGRIYEAVQVPSKEGRNEALDSVREEVVSRFAPEGTDPKVASFLKELVDGLAKKAMRRLIVEEGRRPDGRAYGEIRPITCEVGVLPRTHGSALFTRGQTQALVVVTLGMKGEDEQIIDGLKLEEPPKRFMLHYNFPPFSVGEVRPMRGPGRREIGHGALAERALKCVIPPEEEFPYIIRVVSEILESNGSSSMATVCGGSLALMDAGVPIRKPVAGVAMGLVEKDGRFVVLTDIAGMEDHFGDMDFKVAGTADGITALQLDNKLGGVPREVLERALKQAREARLFILSRMAEAIERPRPDISPYAPRIFRTEIPVDRIRDLIGPGGKTIRGIIQETGAKISVEDDGSVFVASSDVASAKKALSMIHAITRSLEPGEVLLGKVTRIVSFGVFLEVSPGKEGLMHISEVSSRRIPSPEEIFQVGDEVLVVVRDVDDLGRINLSRRRVFDLPAEKLADFEEFLAKEREREELIERKSAPRSSRPSPGKAPAQRPQRR